MLPPILVVNLDRDAERLAHMSEQLRSAGLAFARFAAIEAKALPDELADYFVVGAAHLSAGEIGCYASHLKIAMMAADGELPAPVLVLEDDVQLSPDFAHIVERILACAPSDWDIVRLSFPAKRATLPVAALTPDADLVRYSHVPMSSGAYLISASGARKFVAKRKRKLPIDHDLRRVWTWNMSTYGVVPAPVKNDCLGSSSIDALDRGERRKATRKSRRRLERRLEAPQRHMRGIKDCGVIPWASLILVNMLCRLTPRKQRARLLTWARAATANLRRAAEPSGFRVPSR